MIGRRAFTIIKPNAVKERHIGDICAMIEGAGFDIVAIKMTRLSLEEAQQFYYIHKDKSFFEGLSIFMSEGDIVVMIIERDNAVEVLRELVGSTNPADAADGTIRRLFAESKMKNAIHASDSDENVLLESAFFFG